MFNNLFIDRYLLIGPLSKTESWGYSQHTRGIYSLAGENGINDL